MLAKVHAFVLQGIDAVRCEVEVDHAERAEAGPKPTIVGLPDVGVAHLSIQNRRRHGELEIVH